MAGSVRFMLPRALACTCLCLSAAVALLLSMASGQQAPQANVAPAVTFEAISKAENSLRLRVEQLRRVLEPGQSAQAAPSWVGIREVLTIAPGSTAAPGLTAAPDLQTAESRFRLDFVGFDGETAPSQNLARRRQLYRGYAGYLHLYASLRITDAALAAENYTILYLDARERLGRPTHRVAVLPRRLGRNPWVLEVDAQTLYPLFRAEFSAAGVLVSTLEVTRFEVLDPTAIAGVSWWRPARTVDVYHNDQAALRAIAPAGAPSGLTIPQPQELPAGYAFTEARVVHDDLRPETSLVLAYTDGIDDLFVVETLNTPPPRLPAPSGDAASYAIFVYQDQNIAQFMFHTNGVQTLVVGRAGQFELGPLTQSLLSRSLGNR